jgi:hypothetical protein
MIRKSGNRFSDKIMLKPRDEIMIKGIMISGGDSGYATIAAFRPCRSMVRNRKPATGVHATWP